MPNLKNKKERKQKRGENEKNECLGNLTVPAGVCIRFLAF
jgi:hypothetical protein